MADEAPKKGRATTTPDDQVKFLIACIAHANDGKVNFKTVAEECGIITPGAAAKRYERLLKAHGVDKTASPKAKTNGSAEAAKANGAGADDEEDDAPAPTPVSTPKPKGARAKKATNGDTPKKPAPKKRKLADIKVEQGDGEVNKEDNGDQDKSIFGGGEDMEA